MSLILWLLLLSGALSLLASRYCNDRADRAFNDILDLDDDSLSYEQIVELASKRAQYFDGAFILLGILGVVLILLGVLYGVIQVASWLR